MKMLAFIAGARLNWVRMIQTGMHELSKSRKEKVERALSHACLLSRMPCVLLAFSPSTCYADYENVSIPVQFFYLL